MPTDVAPNLTEAAALLESSQDSEERGTILANLLINHTEALARLYRTRPADFTAFQLKASSIRGMAGRIKEWLRPIKDAAKAQDAALALQAEEAARDTEGASMDALTTGLRLSGLLAPIGYRVDFSGVWEGDDRIALEPVVVTCVARDLETQKIRLELAWRYRGAWRRQWVDRGVAMDARRLGVLSDDGLPVTSETSGRLVRYLSHLEAANGALLARKDLTPRMGWLGPRRFQLGTDTYRVDGEGPVELSAAEGLSDIARGWVASGTWDGWYQATREHLRGRPLVQLAIYAAAVAPLLQILELDGFIVDWSGATSRGKTSALRVAASVWGHPDKAMSGWGTRSTVGPIERAAFLHSLPLILDDTKKLGQDPRKIVASLLYIIPAGEDDEKGRAEGGVRVKKRWRTVLLSSGEKAVVDFTQDAGARARSLCVRGAPFGKDTNRNQVATEDLQARLRTHHGHLGRMLLSEIVERTNYDALRERWKEICAIYAAKAGGSVSRRLSGSVAALHLAGELCHRLGCPGKAQLEKTMEVAWGAAMTGGMDSDRPAAAWRSLYGWVAANVDRFDVARRQQADPPRMGWAGRWDRSTSGNWTELCIRPQLAREQLARWGYDVDYCVNEWARRGWLDHEDGRHTKRKTIAGSRGVGVFVFPFEKVKELCGE